MMIVNVKINKNDFLNEQEFRVRISDTEIKHTRSVIKMGLFRALFWTGATIATGGLALALLPNDWDGIDGYDGGCDE